ncbi:hypothetical protein CBM2605_U10037 [Cupriavidus neocaledonicus]|nr:hypothetical protein CBM2605_U10037 [Cupriavidus neocaledonicus]
MGAVAMASQPRCPGPSGRQVWRTLAVAALAALCSACTSVPDFWRQPRPRAAAHVPVVPAAAYPLSFGGAWLIVVQVDAEASGQLAIYDACRIGKEPFFGLFQAGGRVGPVRRKAYAESTVRRFEFYPTARRAGHDGVRHA